MEVTVPPDWELCAYNGSQETGEAALDDGAHIRLRLTWHKASRSKSPILRLLASVKKTHRKQWGRTAAFHPTEATPHAHDLDIAPYSRDSTPPTHGIVWWRKDCGRAGTLEVIDSASELATAILNSFRVHRESEWVQWSAYGLTFSAPGAYMRCQPSFAAGHLHFRLGASNTDWFIVERWAMANRCLQRLPLEGWPRELLRPAYTSPIRITSQHAATYNECDAVRFEASLPRAGVTRLWQGPTAVAGLVWHVPETDKLLALVASGDACAMLDTVAGSVGST